MKIHSEDAKTDETIVFVIVPVTISSERNSEITLWSPIPKMANPNELATDTTRTLYRDLRTDSKLHRFRVLLYPTGKKDNLLRLIAIFLKRNLIIDWIT
jgi:hypothetical protein